MALLRAHVVVLSPLLAHVHALDGLCPEHGAAGHRPRAHRQAPAGHRHRCLPCALQGRIGRDLEAACAAGRARGQREDPVRRACQRREEPADAREGLARRTGRVQRSRRRFTAHHRRRRSGVVRVWAGRHECRLRESRSADPQAGRSPGAPSQPAARSR